MPNVKSSSSSSTPQAPAAACSLFSEIPKKPRVVASAKPAAGLSLPPLALTELSLATQESPKDKVASFKL